MQRLRNCRRLIWTSFLIFLAAFPAAAQKPKVETFVVGDGLPNLAITDMAQDPSGRLWILSFAGVSVYGGETFETYSSASGLPDEELGALEIDAAGGVWTVTRWTGPWVYRLAGERWRPLPAPASSEPALGSTSLAVLPASGTVAVGSSRHGLWLWDGAAWAHHGAPALSAAALSAAGVRALAAFDGAVAVGTGAGLCLVEDGELDCRPGIRDPLLAEPILGLSAHAGGSRPRLWILAASWLGYLENGRLHLAAGDLRPPGILPQTRGSVQVDAVGGVYFGVQEQLFFLGPERGPVARLGLREGLATEGVTSLLLDRESNVWVASLRGLSKVESRRFLTFDRDSGLLEDEVTAVIEPAPGKLILGHNLGLSFLDLDPPGQARLRENGRRRDAALRPRPRHLDRRLSGDGPGPRPRRRGVGGGAQDGAAAAGRGPHPRAAVTAGGADLFGRDRF